MKSGLILTLIVVLTTVSVSFGQQNIVHDPYLTECKIEFNVTYPDAQPSGNSAANIPTGRIVYLRNEMIRIETKMTDGHTDVMLVDCKNKIAHALNELSGKKYAVKSTPEDIQKECTGIPYVEVKNLDEFKDIAGYNCQKNNYLINNKNNDTFTCDIYTNFKIILTNPNWYNAPYREVAYFMFEYSMKQNGIVVKFSAKSVEPFNESQDIFNSPAGYKIATKEQFAKLQTD